MAVGIGFAQGDLSVGMPLATAIALQDIPEGLAVAMSLCAIGTPAWKAVAVAALRDTELRGDSHQPRIAGKNPLVVSRRGNETRDDQLPHIQAGERRSLLRAHLRSGFGLGMSVWKVQEDEAPRCRLR